MFSNFRILVKLKNLLKISTIKENMTNKFKEIQLLNGENQNTDTENDLISILKKLIKN